MHDSRRRLLRQLQSRGSTTVADLAEAVRLEPVTVRHHLGLLREQGLVVSDTERHGRGRPRNVYHLTSAGRASLSEDRCEHLAGRLLDWVLATDGRAAERFFATAAREAIAAEGGPPAGDMESHLDRTVALLVREGFDACWERDSQGYIIRQRGCPYDSLSRSHPVVCCQDQSLIEAMHPGAVSRETWRPAGDNSCTYRIDPALGAPPPSLEDR